MEGAATKSDRCGVSAGLLCLPYSASDLPSDRGPGSGLGNKGFAVCLSDEPPLLGLLYGNGVKGVGVSALVPQELTGGTETGSVGSGYCWED